MYEKITPASWPALGFRNCITTGAAVQYFTDVIKVYMDQLVTYDAGSVDFASARDTYTAANPPIAGRELQQINTQYRITSFLKGPEAFADFRRGGFPALTTNPYAGNIPAETFIGRLSYPTSEISVNTTNLNAAIEAQGPDLLNTKLGWDK